MWQLLLELLFCAAVITFAPSTQIGLGVWALFWWTSVFWRWAKSAASPSAPNPPSSEAASSFPIVRSARWAETNFPRVSNLHAHQPFDNLVTGMSFPALPSHDNLSGVWTGKQKTEE